MSAADLVGSCLGSCFCGKPLLVEASLPMMNEEARDPRSWGSCTEGLATPKTTAAAHDGASSSCRKENATADRQQAPKNHSKPGGIPLRPPSSHTQVGRQSQLPEDRQIGATGSTTCAKNSGPESVEKEKGEQEEE
ncbi:hypothetical protein cyc_05510 [Cyclospora cayetanensis]|uniref:Uncharacterized protein n=1 Tax=Cyclospora cayetanensis TaxID=88456 RepID=A0A1D3D1Q3_9EIME|nr:hypothetical protein cyc_05510 [Cyclospora cayetanensis]